MEQVGPANTLVRSRTLTPFKGGGIPVPYAAAEKHLAPIFRWVRGLRTSPTGSVGGTFLNALYLKSEFMGEREMELLTRTSERT